MQTRLLLSWATRGLAQGHNCCFLPWSSQVARAEPADLQGAGFGQFVFLGGDRSLVGGAMGGDLGCSGD